VTPPRTFRSMIGQDDGTDHRFARATAEGFGAFILTHDARAPIVMEAGATFHVVTDGIEAALVSTRRPRPPRATWT
jgi:hypothetical protein